MSVLIFLQCGLSISPGLFGGDERKNRLIDPARFGLANRPTRG